MNNNIEAKDRNYKASKNLGKNDILIAFQGFEAYFKSRDYHLNNDERRILK